MSVEFVPAVDATFPLQLPTYALDEEAVRRVLWFFGRPGGREPGGFFTSLLEAMSKADQENLARLHVGFPADAFWMAVLKQRADGLTLAVRALDLVGVKA